jgi:hypothetical protein
MRFFLILAFSSCLPLPALAGLCDDPTPWPDGPDAEVSLDGLMALPAGQGGDGPNVAEPISLMGDVLGLGRVPDVRSAGLEVAEIYCVRARPEWLGVVFRNIGEADARGRLLLTLPSGSVLEAEVPAIPAGGQHGVLLRASEPIAEASLRLAV